MQNPRIEKTIFIDASPETVWEYLTDKSKLGEWFHRAETNLAQGNTYKLVGDKGNGICWGKVVEANAPTRLVYTFTHGMLNNVDTTVIWELSPAHGGTMLKLTHYGFENANVDTFSMLINHDKGWDDHFGRLRNKAAQV